MATEVIMPALGLAQETGILVSWFKAEGEAVAKGEPLMEVETDKATVEIEAPASGVLARVTAGPGDKVPVGKTIALILAPGEPPPAGEASKAPGPEAISSRAQVSPRDELPEEREAPPGRIAASPAARRLARERGIDLSSIKGSGPGGSIVAADVLGAAEAESAGPLPRIKEVRPLSAMRRTIGERMAKSKQSAPHFYLSVDVDMTEVKKKRAALLESEEAIVPSLNDFILWASAQALKQFPALNSAYTSEGIQLFSDINIGIAVALEEGLVVPVIRNADRLAIPELARRSRDLVEKAQRKKLFPHDYGGGTFTVSNLGMLGIDSFVAIINPPQCAILAVGQVAPRVVPYGEGIAIRPMMTMTLSCDHRVVDGAIAARFLRQVKELLEKPPS